MSHGQIFRECKNAARVFGPDIWYDNPVCDMALREFSARPTLPPVQLEIVMLFLVGVLMAGVVTWKWLTYEGDVPSWRHIGGWLHERARKYGVVVATAVVVLIAATQIGGIPEMAEKTAHWLNDIRPGVEAWLQGGIDKLMEHEKMRRLVESLPDDIKDTMKNSAQAGVALVWVGIIVVVGLVISAWRTKGAK